MTPPRITTQSWLIVAAILIVAGTVFHFHQAGFFRKPSSDPAPSVVTAPAFEPPARTGEDMPSVPPSPDAYIARLKPETAQAFAEFRGIYENIDPTDDEAFHQALLTYRRSQPHELSGTQREAFGMWLTRFETMRQEMVEARAQHQGIAITSTDNEGRTSNLTGFNGTKPVYETNANQNAAISTAASFIRRNSSFDSVFGPDIDGAGFIANVNDTNRVADHLEFLTEDGLQNRVTVMRGTVDGDHATHVAGTIASRGTEPAAMGMAPEAQIYSLVNTQNSDVINFGMDWPGRPDRAIVGNSSVGVFDSSINGVYTSTSAAYDQILFDTPYYLHFYAAGNSGPEYFSLSTTRKDGKNLFAVGNLTDASRNSSGVRTGGGSLVGSSAKGPTRDGRIKPDIVANGNGVYSTLPGNGYTNMTGTSMASPNAAGSTILLQDYFNTRFPRRLLRASSLMALTIHTAEDLGPPGPDYTYGWGLMNVLEAGKVIREHANNPNARNLMEDLLNQGQTIQIPYQSDGQGPIRATLVWTDVAGTPQTSNAVTTRSLTNDLNLRVIGPGGSPHLPYVMPYVTGDGSLPPFDPSLLDDSAVTGVNTTDNKIQVYIPSPSAGSYQLEISHAGNLSGGSQRFSLVVTGMASTTAAAPPVITSHPSNDPNGSDTHSFVVTGSGFMLGADVIFQRVGFPPVAAYALETTGSRIEAKIQASALAPGPWQMVVRNPDGLEAISPIPYQPASLRTLTWSGGSLGGNASMLTASNWNENQSPADAPPADLVFNNRNGATGNIATLFVGGDYIVRSISADNSAGRFNPSTGLQIGPTTSSTSTIARTLTFPNAEARMLSATHNSLLEFHRYASTASMTLNLNFEGRAEVYADANSTIRQSTATFTGTGGLRKTGAGTLRLESANSHTGGLTIEEGWIIVTGPTNLGINPSLFVPDTVVLNGGTLSFENSSSGPATNRGFQVGANIGTIHVTGTAVTAFNTISDIPGQAGILAKRGPLILRLNSTNIHSGGTQLLEGRIRYSSSGSFGSGPLTFSENTGIIASAAGLTVANPLVMTEGTVRFGGDGFAHIHNGDLDLTGGVRTIRLSDPVTLNGGISNGTLQLIADSSALALTLNGPLTHAGGTTVTSGILNVNQGGSAPINIGATGSLVIGPDAVQTGAIQSAGLVSYQAAIPANTSIHLDGGTLTNPNGTIVVNSGSSITGTGVIIGNVQLASGSSIEGAPGSTILVLGQITGSGQTSNILRTLSPSTIVNGVETSPIGTSLLTSSLNFPAGFPSTGPPVFRMDLGAPGNNDRVQLQNATLTFGTEGLDLSHFEIVPGDGFGNGVYTLITSSDWISGTIGAYKRTVINGLPTLLRIGNDGTTIELRVGTAADEFPFTAGQTYFGRNNYVEYRAGNMPLVLVSGHDGAEEPAEIPIRTYGTFARDTNLHPLTLAMAAEITARTGKRPHLVLSHLRRNRLDPNREIVEAAQGNPHADQAWTEYHQSFIQTARDAMEKEFGFNLTFDMHGHGHALARLEIGYLLGAQELNVGDETFNLPGYAWQSSLRSLILRHPSLPFSSLVRGERSLGERFIEIGVPAWPSATYPTIGNEEFFSGGYTTAEHSCLDCNSPVNAIQIETHFGVRNNAASQQQFARHFSSVIQSYLVDYYHYSPGTDSFFTIETPTLDIRRGGPSATLTIRRHGHVAEAASMGLEFLGDAVQGADYSISATSATFSAGQTEASILLTPAGTGPAQGDRRLSVKMQPLFRQSTDGSMLDFILGDGVSPVVRITAVEPSISMSSPSAKFLLQRTHPAGPLEVPIEWSGTAIEGGHYDPVNSVVFPAGASTMELSVPLREDSYVEDHLTLVATLHAAIGNGGGFVPGIPSSAEILLMDDDRPDGLAVWLTDGLENNVWEDRAGLERNATTLPGGAGPMLVPKLGETPAHAVFDGASATAAIPRFKADPDGSFSIAFFFRPDVGSLTTERNLVSYGQRGSAGALGIYLSSNNQLRTSLGAGPTVTVSGNWNNGAWRHYALTVNSTGTARIHIDGQLSATSSTWSAPLTANQLFWIGWNPGPATTAGFFKGAIRDFRIYQNTLALANVQSLATSKLNYEAWLAGFGIDPTSAGDSFFQHYSFARNPSAPLPVQPRFEMAGDRFELEFNRQINSSDLRYDLQRSTDLGNGSWETVASLLPGSQTWNILIPEISIQEIHGRTFMMDPSVANGAQPKRFYRVKSNRP